MTSSDTPTPPRVRIAPSPTGDPHVGTAYMALFNYAHARRHGGQFLLRIEDTDRTRSRPEYERAIMSSLRWLGLDWDEGPDVGGPHGPYRQSERLEIYAAHVDTLIDGGHAYRCFQTDEQVAAIKRQLEKDGGKLKFRSPDRDLDPAEARARADAGEPHVVRLRVPDEVDGKDALSYQDPLRKKPSSFPLFDIDDQVLVKTDGFPTYHLANVIDDHLMQITHVIRGEEWLKSLPKHMLLYRGFGWEMPAVYHLPLIRNKDKNKTKLSKRKNPTGIEYYRQRGYLPEALLNFLGTLAYSHNRGEGDEKASLAEFVADFDLDRVQTGGPIWELAKLDKFNKRYISEDHTAEQLYGRLKGWLLRDGYVMQGVALAQSRMSTLADAIPMLAFVLGEVDPDAEALVPKGLDAERARDVVFHYTTLLEAGGDWRPAACRAAALRVCEVCDIKLRQLTHILFVALTGEKVGLPIFDAIGLLGHERTRARLREAIKLLNGGNELGSKAISRIEKCWREAIQSRGE